MIIKKTLTVLLIIILLLIVDIYFEVNYAKIENIVLKSKKLPKGKTLKILHISDVHNKKFSGKTRNLLNDIKKLDPDIIALTGDIIDGRTTDFKNIYHLTEELVKINASTYFVSGNHEWRNPKTKEFMKGLKKRNIKIINNSNEIITKDTFSINVCGIDDPYTNHDDTVKAFNNISKSNFTLLLSHSPNIVLKKNNLPCDLVLCGHTHGGQIRLPFIGGLIAPGQGYFPKYDKGIYRIDNDTVLYINSGFGTSSLPIRFLNRSQVSLITLTGE
ncbi:metallophosphoesterase [Wukongibacter baidiensis]|uniref:metallophosphoesterase n=1 Tax=Wukongibacter baidiensis TaxID=1723361 RepID=UPI003D7FD332